MPEKQVSSDEIREFVLVAIIKPARRKGEKSVSFVSDDIHKKMGLKNRYPQVCSSIDAVKFMEYAQVKLISRVGPEGSCTAKWEFEV